MRRALLFFLLLLSVFRTAFAQKPNELTQPRILILLDESSSMVESWVGKTPRYKAAEEVILNLMDSIYKVNNQVAFSLRVFGREHTVDEHNCYDTRNEVMFSKDNRTQMAFRLEDMHPLGVTPIAFALKEAAENDLIDQQEYAYSIILITDGGESCGGDICDVVKTLISKKVYFKPYIVSLVDYAPLKTEYACLGDYLQVTSNKDVPKAVNTIVDAYRPMLTLTKQEYKQLKTILETPPSVLKVNIPSIAIPVQEPEAQAPKPAVKQTPVIVKEQPKPKPAEKPAPVIVKEQPKPKPVIEKPKPEPVAEAVKPEPIPTPEPIPVKHESHIAVQEIAQPKRDTVTRMTAAHIHLIHNLFVLPENDLRVVKVPEVPKRTIAPEETNTPVAVKPAPPKPEPKPAPPVVAAKPPAKPKPKAPAKKPATPELPAKEVTADVATENAKETGVSVYFTNGKGKFYHTTPQVLLIDPNTGQAVKKFYRTTDADGNPDLQTGIAPGVYNVMVTGKNNLVARSVRVEKDKNNKINIIVTNGSLKFSYDDAPNKPVEYTAIVAQRMEIGGKTVAQKCTEEKAYEPGNYFIEINTVPVTRRNLDLDFNSITDERIPEPGYVQFTNTKRLGRVGLYCTLGDGYAKFMSVDIKGNAADQKIKLQPGAYQAHYIEHPDVPYSQDKIFSFNVRSNQVTETEIK